MSQIGNTPGGDGRTRIPDDSEAAFEQPERIGTYRIVSTLGEGGMGVVYDAEQQSPVRRRVALKVIKHGMDTRHVIARFESERQTLALMSHENIARVYDAGTTERGRPYFVMEFVRGTPITLYCDRQELGVRSRLELFIRVCNGVQHAHQKGIIHRDIKPSNVLVGDDDDGSPVPKIIDFGIAKATSGEAEDGTRLTEIGQLVGTPEYMSPEQAAMTGPAVDTRTDVYLLGILLYELLTGVLPFDASTLRESGFIEYRRRILEVDPPRPSTRISRSSDRAADIARARSTESRSLARRVRGDLDWITMKALEKEPGRRYSSASELAADVARFLRHEPIAAHPPSRLYVLGKLARRNKLAASFAAVLLLLLAGFAGTMTVQASRIARERDRASQERTRAEQEAASASEVSDFLQGLFVVSDPNEARGETITAREILDRGAERIRGELAGQPRVQGRMMQTIGNVYWNLGLPDKARGLLEEALAVQRESLGRDDPEVATTLDRYAGLLALDYGDLEGAVERYREALEIRRARLGPGHRLVGWSMNNLANLLEMTGDYAGALELYRGAYDVWSATLEPDHPDLAIALNNQAFMTVHSEGDHERARGLYESALEDLERVAEPDDPRIALVEFNLGSTLTSLGELPAARRHLSRALEIREQVFGREHAHVGSVLTALAVLSLREGDRHAAETLHARAWAIFEATNSWNSPREVYFEAGYLALLGERDEALRFLRRATLELGFGGAALLEHDRRLESLRGDADFEAILTEVRARRR